MTAIAYGIDFGTTNSSVSIADTDGTVELAPLGSGGETSIPSILYLDPTGNRSVGDLAVRTHLVNGVGHGRLLSSLKQWLTDESFTKTESPDGRPLSMPDLVAGILTFLKQQADRQTGSRCDRAVIGRPVVFAGAEGPRFEAQTTLAKERLVEAGREAGFREVALLDEATAALYGDPIESGILLAADFGGGTFDVSVVKAATHQRTVLSTHGVAVGGEYFDSLLFDDAVAAQLRLTQEHLRDGKLLPVPGSIRQMRSLSGTLAMMSDDRAEVTLERWQDSLPEVSRILLGGHGYAFYRTVEGAKIALSSADQAKVDFSRPDVRVTATAHRSRFEDLLGPSLVLVSEAIDRALDLASVSPQDVSHVLRTGGSSRIPAFVRMIEQRFGRHKVHERDVFATVALGLGVHARSLWG